jgi:hypothetical protein
MALLLKNVGVKEGKKNRTSAADGTSDEDGDEDSGSSDGGSRTPGRRKKRTKHRAQGKGLRDHTQQQQQSEGKMREAIHRKSSLLNVVKQKYEQVQCLRLSG